MNQLKRMMSKRVFQFLLLGGMIILLTGCLPGPDSVYAAGEQSAGFIVGYVHGFIAPVTLIISYLNDSIRMYEVINAGPEYDMGFLFGIVTLVIIPFLYRIIRRVW